jgi:hypothetical protein
MNIQRQNRSDRKIICHCGKEYVLAIIGMQYPENCRNPPFVPNG